MSPDSHKVLTAMGANGATDAEVTSSSSSPSSSSASSAVRPSIPAWFAGKRVLVTGATGFMGKVLVEKLLRDCPQIERMYLLVRRKKGVEPAQRRDEYVNHMVSVMG